ncbi:Ferredoxin-2 [Mycobacteroides salmoniphilum]|uniref:Ferredoxin n=2 Tax=Mycobacteroides salmoniphilum TaxID=404941 RepID=A0A4V3HXP3_9MYCO|nr:Ferredoxin-2 [Mycobacteroides salmoniphilum]
MPMDSVTVGIDHDICMGSGYCVREHPELFRMTTEGVAELYWGAKEPVLSAVPDKFRKAAEDASAICPAAAITVSDR